MVTENMVVRPFISALLRNAKTKGLTTVAVRCREKGQSSMNYPAASCGVSKTIRYDASFGEYAPERFNGW